ncbi:hemagglutinin repeat-containing protein, partial [Dialister invisus]|uniref:hemagglutinin repeat-containing protein n=1 Tax=Dialister invisus TaxID=218538 RepID=UPI002E78EB7C
MKASSVILDALKDMDNTGTLEAEKKMDLYAGKDIRMTADTHREENGQGHTTAISKRGAASVTGKESSLTMTAGKDIHLQAARISSAGDMTIAGKRQVELGTAVAEKDNRVTWDRSNDRRDSTAMETGSTLTAGRNLTVENGKEITDLEEHHRHKEKGLLSSKTTTTYDEVKRTDTTGSIVEGDTLTMTAGKDISLTGSVAASTKETALSAGRNISIHAAEETDKEIHKKQVKKRGLIGSRLGFTIGSEKKKDSYDTEETTQRGSTVGSVKGNVTITAGQTASVSASDIIAGKDTLITGRNVDIESKDNTYRGKEEHEYKKSGLTVSLGGALITAKDNVIRPIKNAGQAHDGLLGKLYAADAGFNLHDAVKTYKNIGDVKKGITLDVSIGSRSAKSDSRYQGTEAKESRIVSQGNIRIKSDENIAVKGSQITGENVTLQAGKDISLTAAENRKTTEGNSRSKGAGITASFGIGGLQNVGISAGKSKGNMEEEIMTHTGSAVTAKETLAMESGKDLNITGSKAGGKKVEVKTGNNLSIESLQDSHTYHSRDKESGIHLQRDITVRPDTGKKKMDDPYFSIGKKTDTTDSTYESVTKQAGIYAGKEGYDIQVKNNTRLKGAVIDSKAPAEKNKLTTGTLT